MAKLYLMMGCPGSGKSTWCKNHLSENDVYVSRDEIRFSLVKEEDEYFSKENQVYKEFVNRIGAELKAGHNVFADATHINKGSRLKLLRSINYHDYEELGIIWVKVPLETALSQNENRKDTRAYVPESVIRNMYKQTEPPSFEEGFDKIYFVEPNEAIIVKVRVE